MRLAIVTYHRAAIFAGVLVLALVLALAAAARADLIPSGHRGVPTRVVLDLGPNAATAPRVHTVVAGETLGKITTRYLGSSRRWHEIVALNPGLDPKNLKVKQRLVIPPAPAENGTPTAITHHFFSFRFTLPQFVRKQHAKNPLRAPRRLYHGHAPWITKHGAIFVAVPAARLGEWQEHLAAGLTEGRLEKLRDEGVVAYARVKGVSGIVRDADDVKQIRATLTIGKVNGKKLVVTRKIERLDAKGKKIGMAADRRILLFASGAGLLALATIVIRRRRRE